MPANIWVRSDSVGNKPCANLLVIVVLTTWLLMTNGYGHVLNCISSGLALKYKHLYIVRNNSKMQGFKSTGHQEFNRSNN